MSPLGAVTRWVPPALLIFAAQPALGQPGAEDDDPIEIVDTPLPGPGAAPASAIPRRQLTEDAATDLPEVLHEQPGLRVTRLGGLGAFSTVSIRGSTAEQVAVFLDGVPLNQDAGGPVDLSTLPLGPVGSVAIHRHVAPIGYGVSALGGVVALSTRAPKHTEVEMAMGGGSFGSRLARGYAATGGPGAGVGVSLDYRGTQGDFEYVDDGGTRLEGGDDRRRARRHNMSDQASALVNGRLRRGDAQLSGLALLQWRDQQLPGLGSLPAEEASLTALRVLGGAHGVLHLAPLVLTATPYLTFNRTQLRDPRSEIGLGADDTEDDTWAAGLISGLAGHWEAGGWRVSPELVLTGRLSRFTPSGTSPALAGGQATERLRGSGALGITVSDDRWRLVGEGRYAHLRSEARRSGQRASDGLWTGRVGARRDWGDHRHGLRLSVDGVRAVRFPDLFEQFGNTGAVVGNPDLRPEAGWQADAGLVYALARGPLSARLEAHAFWGRISDLIQFERNSQGALVARNVDTAAITGAELGLWAQAGHRRGIRVRGALTGLDARSDGDRVARSGQRLPLRPGRQAFGRLGVFDVSAHGERGLAVEVDHTADNYLDFANLVAVPDRTLWGLSAWAERGPLRLDVTARNLADRGVVDLAGYPLPGLSVMALVTARPRLEGSP